MDAQPTPEATCPRCGGGFHCGVDDAVPCACTRIALTPVQRAALNERYRGCLCLRCLAEIGERGELSAAPAADAS